MAGNLLADEGNKTKARAMHMNFVDECVGFLVLPSLVDLAIVAAEVAGSADIVLLSWASESLPFCLPLGDGRSNTNVLYQTLALE